MRPARARLARRRQRRRAAIGASLITLGAAAILVANVALFDCDCIPFVGGGRASIEAEAAAVEGGVQAPPTTAAPVTVAPTPNPLLAPPPTVLPALDDGSSAPLVRRVDTTDRVVFITIDDGQVRDPAVLDHLLELDVPFTSFLTQPLAVADPEFWKGTQAAWGMIETHTIRHPNLHEVGPDVQRREICEPADTFEELFGRRPTLFRPPYGNSNDSVRRIAKDCGYDAVVHWTGSTNNGVLSMQEGELKPGDIILMHYRDTLRADLDDVVRRVTEEGFTIGRLEDYLSPGR